jgi:hypothetical protein
VRGNTDCIIPYNFLSELSYNRLMSGYYNADWAARLQQALSLLEEADSRGEMLSMQTLSKDLGLRLAVLRRLRVELV